jgi:hypothetical protein
MIERTSCSIIFQLGSARDELVEEVGAGPQTLAVVFQMRRMKTCWHGTSAKHRIENAVADDGRRRPGYRHRSRPSGPRGSGACAMMTRLETHVLNVRLEKIETFLDLM